MYAFASGVIGSYLVSKSFGVALGIYINEFSISPKIEFNAIVDVPNSSRYLVYTAFGLAIISAGAQGWNIHKERVEKRKLDEEFGYKLGSEA
jgi:hypothetical protein